MTPQEQVESARLTQEHLEDICGSLEETTADVVALQNNISADEHPVPHGVTRAIEWHLEAARSLCRYLDNLNTQFGEDGMARLHEQGAQQAAESAASGSDRREVVEQIARALGELGLGAGTVVMVRVSEDEDEDTENRVNLH